MSRLPAAATVPASACRADGSLPPALTAPQRRRLPPLLRAAWFGLNQSFRRRIARLGITPNQYTALRWLQEHDPLGLTQRQLTALMASDPNTTVALIGRMLEAGWITRTIQADDRRKHRIRILPRGSRLFKRAEPIAAQLMKEVQSAVAPLPVADFLAALLRIAELCNHLQNEPDPEKTPVRR